MIGRVALSLALLACSVSGFVTRSGPAPVATRRSVRAAPAMKVDGLVGATAPFGYFDPLGLSKGKTLDQMVTFREAELKHGRIAMAATLGWVVQPVFHPLAKSCHVSNPTDPIKSLSEVPPVGWLQVFIFIGFLEFLGIQIKKNPTYVPGDLLGASELVDNTDVTWVKYQQKELNNGRLAMFAIMGFWIQDLLFQNTGDMLFKPLVS
eukprot:CAMPEP_0118961968 /NCGR_PEP_ID=MMETSP1173-20130426/473_1 /TAXON_ID=1034831 /ORGANISM="Rhizochromulina marina cf, Strain CCMP1243" /LENGTH=206 /DNA_ID=CAMNT_0006910177 /DNA_START=30 /DNA_END=650 /DNA_ORIENTATION=+